MKKSLLLFLLFACQNSYSEYKTFLQVGKASEVGKYLVIFSVSNEESELEKTGGVINAILAPGETKKGSYRSRFSPEIEYFFDIEISDNPNLDVTIKLIITNKGNVFYENSYKTFITHSSGF